MIPWWWLGVAFMVGAFVGWCACALATHRRLHELEDQAHSLFKLTKGTK